MKSRLEICHQMAKDAVGGGIAVLVVLLLLEGAMSGFVAAFFNMTWLVLWIFAASLIAFATHHDAHEHSADASGAGLWALVVLAAAAIVWARTPPELAVHWRAIAAGGTLFVGLLALSLLKKE
jgi:hypothetical protein